MSSDSDANAGNLNENSDSNSGGDGGSGGSAGPLVLALVVVLVLVFVLGGAALLAVYAIAKNHRQQRREADHGAAAALTDESVAMVANPLHASSQGEAAAAPAVARHPYITQEARPATELVEAPELETLGVSLLDSGTVGSTGAPNKLYHPAESSSDGTKTLVLGSAPPQELYLLDSQRGGHYQRPLYQPPEQQPGAAVLTPVFAGAVGLYAVNVSGAAQSPQHEPRGALPVLSSRALPGQTLGAGKPRPSTHYLEGEHEIYEIPVGSLPRVTGRSSGQPQQTTHYLEGEDEIYQIPIATGSLRDGKGGGQ